MTIEEFYTEIGGDFADVKHRLMTEKFILRFVMKFPTDPSMQELLNSVAKENIEDAFRAVHTLKGVAANLSFTKLYEAASALTEQLRGKNDPADTILLNKVKDCYDNTILNIEKLQASQS